MISLIITCQGRTHHLQRLLEGVKRNSVQPEEIVIVSNDVEEKDLPKGLNLKIIPSPFEGFPIGKNRNFGAENVSHQNMYFLDVDCIPEKHYFEKLQEVYNEKDGLVMGNPYYLKNKVEAGFKYEDLNKDAIAHPHRPEIQEARKEEDYAIFWSLCFAISKENFDKIGGFDTNFIGYGAEDTDFGFMAREKEIPFFLSPAIAYHQQHPIYRPPVNHLKDIVYNSNLFKRKWDKWPMEGWLQTFVDKGWICWNEDADTPIEIIEYPSKQEVETYRVEDARFV